jgi:hypothetical protein
MKRLVEFKLTNNPSDESTIVVEINEPEPEGGVTRASRGPGQMLDVARDTFETGLEKIHRATESAIAKLRNLSEKPDEVTMEFGFNLNAEFGAIIASAGVEANYKVTISWSKKPEE